MKDYKFEFTIGSGLLLEVERITLEITSGTAGEKVYIPGHGGSIVCTPVVHKGVIYIGCCDGMLYVVSLKGEVLWKFQTGDLIATDLSVQDDVIYTGSYDGNLYAISAKGKLKWKFHVGEHINSAPVVHKGVVYFGADNGFLYAVSTDGKLKWKFQTGGEIWAAVRIHKDVIYFGSFDGRFYALDLDGKVLWSLSFGEMIISRPVICSDHIFPIAFDDKVHKIDLSGEEKWAIEPGIVLAGLEGTRAFNNKIYFPCIDYFYCVNADTGETVWKYYAGSPVFCFSVIKGVVYIDSPDQHLHAVDAETGQLIWKFNAGSYIYSNPILHRGVIYLGTWNGRLLGVSERGEKVLDIQLSSAPPSPVVDYFKKGSEAKFIIEDFEPEAKIQLPKLDKAVGSDYNAMKSRYSIGLDKDYTGKGKKKKGYQTGEKHYK